MARRTAPAPAASPRPIAAGRPLPRTEVSGGHGLARMVAPPECPAVGAAVVDARAAGPGGALARRLAAAGLPRVWAGPGEPAAGLWARAGGAALGPGQVVVVLVPAEHAGEWRRGLGEDSAHRFEVLPLVDVERDAPGALARRNAASHPGAVLVGHAMALERELDLARRGLLPLHPAHGACFFPLVAEHDASEGPVLTVPAAGAGRPDVLLHKATDWIRFGACAAGGQRLPPPALAAALETAAGLPDLSLVDPLPDVWRLTDRFATLEALEGLESAFGGRVRVPRSAVVAAADVAAFSGRAGGGEGVGFPCIVKSNHACGLPGAHRMGVARDGAGLRELLSARPGVDVKDVPPPWLVQEYINHRPGVLKVYCVGAAVVGVCLRGSPGGRPLVGDPPAAAFRFDSGQDYGENLPEGDGGLGADPGLLEDLAAWVGRALGLRLFGFDVLREELPGALVVVDVNYFPSYNGVPGVAAPIHSELLQVARRKGKERAASARGGND